MCGGQMLDDPGSVLTGKVLSYGPEHSQTLLVKVCRCPAKVFIELLNVFELF